MEDITIVFYTLNKPPKHWQEFHKKALLEAAGDSPVITLSKEPMDWGHNVVQTEPESMSNIYWQILKGCKLAKTPYVALVEDDTLYSKEHFAFRPPLDTVAFNHSRWAIFTWGEPFYFFKDWDANCTTIAPRDLMVEALEERFAKYPVLPRTCAVGVGRVEKQLGLTRRKSLKFFTIEPVVCFHHKWSHNPAETQKKPKPLRAYDIPKWGRAEDLVKEFR